MTSRPSPGIQESPQLRGGEPAYAPVSWTVSPQHGHLCSYMDGERAPAEEPVVPLEGIQTVAADSGLPTPWPEPELLFSSPPPEPELLFSNPPPEPELLFSNPPPGSSELPTHGGVMANLPVPPRLGSALSGDVSQQCRILPGGTGVKNKAAVRPQRTDVPAEALVFPGDKSADLFPWTGSQPEDMLSDALVKSGTGNNGPGNKSQIATETTTARTTVWQHVNDQCHLAEIEKLLVAIFDKRQSSSRLTAPHIFQPPPRLTLRDTKRENWLKDLADPTVRLARLGRTIPTGVTGKVLLEQCLNKNIPIRRAMWLAKCIGVNEIKSHQRKSQAGTNNHYLTWVRGWTSAVEQFLESQVVAFGQEEWKARITYALSLTAGLFNEHLLENDHFLDWALKGLDSSSTERLFIWILVVCIPPFRDNIISSRRRGKRLAESLLDHAKKPYSFKEPEPTCLLHLLERTILQLLIDAPTCFLLPKTWEKHGMALQTFAQRQGQAEITRAVADLDTRNSQLLRPSGVPGPEPKDPTAQVYHLLDSVNYSVKFDINELASDCMRVNADVPRLASIAMQWASSLYRQGSHRIYLVTRLLCMWSQPGVDIYDSILGYLSAVTLDKSKEPDSMYRIIAELIRSNTFPLGRFLQWVIATGSLSRYSDLSSVSAWPLKLLTAVPLTGLSWHVHNLRRTLLRGTVYPVDAEEKAIDTTRAAILRQLQDSFDAEMRGDGRTIVDVVDVVALSPTVRLEIGIWLRRKVAASVEQAHCEPGVEASGTECRMSLSNFLLVRTYLEKLDDLAILADVIDLVATSLNCLVLSAAADTLHYNYVAFRAIGVFDSLFERIAGRYAAIRTVRVPERELLHSLIDLSRTAQTDPELVQLLNYDISRYDQNNQNNSLAVCSPVSDTMLEGGAAWDLEDGIERILLSGTSMDQQMMSRVFGKIAKYLEEQLCKGVQHVESLSTWVDRLRSFDESAFDAILSSWLGSLLIEQQLTLLSAALPPLVVSGSFTLSRFLTTVRECIGDPRMNQPADSLRVAAAGLQEILPRKNLSGNCRQQDLYRYRLEQHKFCRERNSGLLDLIRDVVELEFSLAEHEHEDRLLNTIFDERLLEVLRDLAVQDIQILSTLTAVGPHSSAETIHTRIKLVLDRLVDPVGHPEFSEADIEEQIAAVVQSADPLSLPFSRLVLQQIFSGSTFKADDETDRLSAALVAAIETAIDADRPFWPRLMSGLEPALMKKIREHAENEIISASQFLCWPTVCKIDVLINDRRASVRKYLSVIDAVSTGAPQEVQSGLLLALVERFRGVAELLSVRKEALKSGTVVEGTSINFDLIYWLNALLRLAVVYGPVLMLKASNQHQLALMWALRMLLIHPALNDFPSTAQSLFDVATLLSDSISDDVRKQLAGLDIAKPVEDNRCAFIFGSVPPPDGWLITTHASATSNEQASSAHTQPQPPNAGHSQYQGPPPHGQGPGPGALQRSTSQQQVQQPMQPQTQKRTYSQYSQPPKELPQQLQRMASNGQSGQGAQLHELQQMPQRQHTPQRQQRTIQPSLGQQQRTPVASTQPTAAGKAGAARQENVEMRRAPFALNSWEILPEYAGNALGNDTPISLGLFGARKV